MADDNQGECKSCGENAGSKPAAKSAAEVARESWLQDVTVRPYQPTVEALAAARTGARSASEGLGLTAKAMSAFSMEEHRPMEAPREFPAEPLNPTPRAQPRTEVSYLSAPWDHPAFQEPRISPTPADGHQWPRATQPQDPHGAIKADPRANADVEYLSWFPGDGSPWLEVKASVPRSSEVSPLADEGSYGYEPMPYRPDALWRRYMQKQREKLGFPSRRVLEFDELIRCRAIGEEGDRTKLIDSTRSADGCEWGPIHVREQVQILSSFTHYATVRLPKTMVQGRSYQQIDQAAKTAAEELLLRQMIAASPSPASYIANLSEEDIVGQCTHRVSDIYGHHCSSPCELRVRVAGYENFSRPSIRAATIQETSGAVSNAPSDPDSYTVEIDLAVVIEFGMFAFARVECARKGTDSF